MADAIARALGALLLAVCTAVAAQQALPLSDDPVLEAQVQRIASDLRCLVCQNETIAASHADLAVDLRNQIREQLKAGRSEQQIRDYMVARYGDFVLYRPPLKATTVLLWVGPALLLIGGFWMLRRVLRTRRDASAPPDLTPEEAARARALLAGEAEKPR